MYTSKDKISNVSFKALKPFIGCSVHESMISKGASSFCLHRNADLVVCFELNLETKRKYCSRLANRQLTGIEKSILTGQGTQTSSSFHAIDMLCFENIQMGFPTPMRI